MKKIIALLIAAAAFTTAKADGDSYIYWMISGSDVPSFNYASLYVEPTSGGDATLVEIASDVDSGTQTSIAAHYTQIDTALLGSGYRYYVELLNADMESTHRSQIFGYTALSYSVYTKPNAPATTAINFNSYEDVPEPTSGLMMLLGVALLGLKRKRV